MSISTGIVSTKDINAKSYAQIASIATEVKKWTISLGDILKILAQG
jgi:hypothetical protein